MIARCILTEAAVRLSLELEAYSVPDDFQPAGNNRQVIARIRDEYTNYKELLGCLPACPLHECGRTTETGCASHDLALDILEIEARRLAVGAYAAWQARQQEAGAANKAENKQPAWS